MSAITEFTQWMVFFSVISMWQRLEMLRIYAPAIPTFMMDVVTFRDWPDPFLIGKSMRCSSASIKSK
jgi:hypothetical protein